jgi:hypothetical protein
MCLLLSRGLSKVGTRGLHRARRGSAANHEIICRTHTRSGTRTAWAESPWHPHSVHKHATGHPFKEDELLNNDRLRDALAWYQRYYLVFQRLWKTIAECRTLGEDAYW